MKQDKSVKAFKNELRNYTYYQERIAKLNELIEYCYSILSGVKGIDPSKEPIHSPPNKDNEYRLRDEIEKHNKNLIRVQEKVKEIDEILSRITDDSIKYSIIRVYINNESIYFVSLENFISASGLAKAMNKAIKKAIE